MQLRSGTVLSYAKAEECKKWIQNFYKPDRFYEVLDEDQNPWPTREQAKSLATNSLDKEKFTEHCAWIVKHGVPGCSGARALKANRLVHMVMAFSLINVLHDPVMKGHFGRLANVAIAQFKSYEGKDFPVNQIIDELSSFL
jgi:hypothetical protein